MSADRERRLCAPGGGNDYVMCRTCLIEYAPMNGEPCPPCPRAEQDSVAQNERSSPCTGELREKIACAAYRWLAPHNARSLADAILATIDKRERALEGRLRSAEAYGKRLAGMLSEGSHELERSEQAWKKRALTAETLAEALTRRVAELEDRTSSVEGKLITIAEEWAHGPSVLLRCSEMTAQELRTAKAAAAAVVRDMRAALLPTPEDARG